MENRYLFSHRWKPWGWLLLLVGLIAGTCALFLEWQPGFLDVTVINVIHDGIFPFQDKDYGWFVLVENNIVDELSSIFIIIGAVLVAFCRVRLEDEYIAKIRQESLVWAFYLHYALLLIAIIFLYELTFYYVMVITMFTPLLFFIVRFHLALQKLTKSQVA